MTFLQLKLFKIINKKELKQKILMESEKQTKRTEESTFIETSENLF